MTGLSPGYYAYAWNLHDMAGEIAAMRADGMRHLAIAASYHAGKFIQPRDPFTRVYFPEDGTVYFRPRSNAYGLLKPLASTLVAERDPLDDACRSGELSIRAWTVLNHNSRLGFLHPDTVARNAWGDPYCYSLCPSHPAVRHYAVTLCADLAENHDLECLLLESPGWLVYDHGYHHEFAQAVPSLFGAQLMGLCFCNACEQGARAGGLDIAPLRQQVRQLVDAEFAGQPQSASPALIGDLAAFHAWRGQVVTSLCAEIRAAVRREVGVRVISTCQRPHATAYLEGGDLNALSRTADGLELPLYQTNVQDLADDLDDVVRTVGSVKGLSTILRPGHPDMQSENQLRETLSLLLAAGIEDISFYNFGMLPIEQIGWVREAVGELMGQVNHA